MALQERLDAIRTGFREQVSAEVKEAMTRATAELKASGRLEGALGEGDPAPDFVLADEEGREVSSAALRGEGPLVLTFFRGFW